MATYVEVAENMKTQVEAAIGEAKAALNSNNFDAYEKAKAAAVKKVDEYNDCLRNVYFEEFAKDTSPLMKAIRAFYITSYRVKEVHDKETEKTTDIVTVANDKTRVDIEDFVDFAKLDKKWLVDTTNLLSLLQLRKTDIYTLSAADLTAQSYFFMNAVRKKKDGETPDSNTKIVALLQKIVDATIFEDNGKGLNKHKVTARDIAFIEDCCHQFDPKAKAGIKSLKARGFQTVMVSVLYSMLTGEGYTVKNAKISKD